MKTNCDNGKTIFPGPFPIKEGPDRSASSRSGPPFRKLCMTVVISIMVFLILTLSTVLASPFQMPEKFVYDLTWGGIQAGTASLELRNDGGRIRIISTAQSAKWISVFYTVDDRVESILSQDPYRSSVALPVSYRLKLREGKHRKDKEVMFDHEKNRAKYVDHLEKEYKEIDVPALVFDPISSFFYLRTRRLVVGEPVYITMFDSKKVYNVEVQVLRREKVTIPEGTFDTIVVKPLMKSEGIFYRKGEIFIWLTDDAKHIPVKMQTKIPVGHITATLVQGVY